MAELVEVPIGTIDPNPYRLLATYPYNERKIEALMRSLADVGAWERIIARPSGNRFQMAFGHHLLEAARRQNLPTITLIVRDLNDEAMLRFMGRENAEEFNADFLVMLETWEAAAAFVHARKKSQLVDIARFLGWMTVEDKQNDTARACGSALALINAGHLTRDDLRDLVTSAVTVIVERTLSRVEMLERLGKMGKRPAKEIEADKRFLIDAAKSVARDVRDHNLSRKDIRGEIDYRTVKTAAEQKRVSPLFAEFADEVATNIHKLLVADKTAEKLQEMEQGLPNVELDEDFASLRRVDFALAEHETVTGKWRTRLTRKGEKVVPFKLLKGG